MIDACRLRREERYKACVDDVPLDRPKTTGKEHSSMKKEFGDGLFRLLAPSVAGLLACVVCLCATSWAWFSASVTAAATTIHSASYTVSVTVRQGETPVEVAEEAGVYSVKFLTDGEYTVTLAPTPESTATTGYCLVKYNETTYCTDQLVNREEPLQFTVHAAQDESLTITPIWGTYTGSEFKPLAELSLPTNDPVEADQPESDVEPVEPPTTDEPKDEEQGQTPEENSGTEAPETPTEPAPDPATDNTPAEGETDSNSGDPETTPDASAPETPVPDPTPSDTPAPTPPESEN